VDGSTEGGKVSAQYKALLQWVAENVYEISSVSNKAIPNLEIVEIEYWLDDEREREIARGSGETVWVAFIRALNKAREDQALLLALKKMPRRLAKRFAETEINKNFYSKETTSVPANKKAIPRRRRAKD
jgi:hypothetical protein